MDEDEELLLALNDCSPPPPSAPARASAGGPSAAPGPPPGGNLRPGDLAAKYARQHRVEAPPPNPPSAPAKAFAALQGTPKAETLTPVDLVPDAERSEHTDPTSGFGLRNRVLFSPTLQRMLRATALGFVRLADVPAQAPRLSAADESIAAYRWATMAVVTSKTETKGSASGKKYIVLRISDLEAVQTAVLLFGAAYEAHMALDRGAVILLLAPKVMEAKSGFEDRALSIFEEDQLHRVGTSTELAFCPATKRASGEVCGAAVSKRRGGYCTYHLRQAYQATGAARVDVVGGLLKPALRPGVAKGGPESRPSAFDAPKAVVHTPMDMAALLTRCHQGSKQLEGQRAHRQQEEDMRQRLARKMGLKPLPASAPPKQPAAPSKPEAPTGPQAEIRALEARMRQHAAQLEFEKAAALRDRLQALKTAVANARAAQPAAVAASKPAADPAARLLQRAKAQTTQSTSQPPSTAPQSVLATRPKPPAAVVQALGLEPNSIKPKRGLEDVEDRLLAREAKRCRPSPADPARHHPTEPPAVSSLSQTSRGKEAAGPGAAGPPPAGKEQPVVGEDCRRPCGEIQNSARVVAPAGGARPKDPTAASPNTPTSGGGLKAKVTFTAAPPNAQPMEVRRTNRSVSLEDCMAGKGPAFALTSTVTEAIAASRASASPSAKGSPASGCEPEGHPLLDPEAILSAARKETSRYESAAQQAATHQMDQHLERLEKRDVLAAEMAKITEQRCQGHQCKECDRIFEFPQTFCREMGHTVTAIEGIKRWFECNNCRVRVVAYNVLYPRHGCPKCHNGDWRQASMWREFAGPELRPKMLPRGEETGFCLRTDPLLMAGLRGDD